MLQRLLDRIRAALPRITAGNVSLLACWFGLFFGMAEGVVRAVRRSIQHQPAGRFTAAELLWMTPLAAVVTFLVVALLFVLADRLLRSRGLILQFAMPLLVTLGVHDLIDSMRLGVVSVAAWILGLGCAAAATRLYAAKGAAALPRMRWPLPLAMGAIALWAVAVPVTQRVKAQKAHDRLPAAAANAPNVLVIIWDTVRSLSLSLYGYSRETTPELARIAKTGTVFESAFATSSWSLPSHASLYTGRYPNETKVGHSTPLDDEFPTLGDVLAKHGYVTGGFTGNLYYGSRDFGMARGFSWYDDASSITTKKIASTYSVSRRVLSAWLQYNHSHAELVTRPADDIRAEVLRWIDRRGKRPFYAFVNFFDAHAPYFAPPPFNVAFAPSPPRYWIEEPRPTDPAIQRELETAYESSIRYLDHELGQFIAQLKRRGVLDNTLVILTADHGEQFGDHGTQYLGHERSLYASVLRVPLVMIYPPRVPAGVRRAEPVSIRDIPITVLDVLGLDGEDNQPFPGISLLRYATGTATEAEIAEPRFAHMRPSQFFPEEFLEWARTKSHIFSLVSGRLQYIVNASGHEELYDFLGDPWEKVDLMRDSSKSASLARFRATLDSIIPPWRHISPDTIAH